jgi:propanol-preferring alcohol dehydrogenase
MVQTMRAYTMVQWQKPPQLLKRPVPEPGPGEILLKVAGNGICQSDLHLMQDWTASPPHLDIKLPMVIGHEIAGRVERCGPGVDGFEKGQTCLVTLAGCGKCRNCAEGRNNYCAQKPRQPGIGLDGGLADFVVVPQACLVPFEGLDPVEAAPLTDAGLSSWHAVNRIRASLFPGARVVAIGIGGLGHLAIAALAATTAAQIIAIDPNPAARNLALENGATQTLAPDDPEASRLQAEAIIDFVGSAETISLATKIIDSRGHIVIVGRGEGSYPLTHSSMAHGAMISTTFGGSKAELMDLVALVRSGAIRPHITRYPLDRVAEAFDLLAAGKITGRAVIVP